MMHNPLSATRFNIGGLFYVVFEKRVIGLRSFVVTNTSQFPCALMSVLTSISLCFGFKAITVLVQSHRSHQPCFTAAAGSKKVVINPLYPTYPALNSTDKVSK